ncbi:MAG: hypothetical protein KF716_09225 [Anaerolineae bacterium]|nr:hypothetical protein [Anaerolineae bacterium]
MTSICPECGARLSGDETCQTIFEMFLSREYVDPAYGAVHFLTVACFMLQHGRYSDQAVAWMRDLLRDYLDQDLTPAQLRHRASQGTSSQSRQWKVLRAGDAPPLPKVAWSMTIADVAHQYTDADSYRVLITQWARVTLREISALQP